MTAADRRTALYRVRAADGRLLYVGISMQPATRIAQHAYDKPWWSEVARVDVTHFANRDEAIAAEAEAIRTESPVHNLARPGRPVPPDVLAARRAIREERRQREAAKWGRSYWADGVACVNCGLTRPRLAKAVLVSDQECPDCGCKTLQRKDVA